VLKLSIVQCGGCFFAKFIVVGLLFESLVEFAVPFGPIRDLLRFFR
jgi:hypothetical protein